MHCGASFDGVAGHRGRPHGRGQDVNMTRSRGGTDARFLFENRPRMFAPARVGGGWERRTSISSRGRVSRRALDLSIGWDVGIGGGWRGDGSSEGCRASVE